MNSQKYFDIISLHFNTDKLTELYYTNEFTLAVAVILSAQATDKHVNTVTPALFAKADSPESMIALSESRLKEFIKSVSFFNNKAANIIKLSRVLTDSSDSKTIGNKNWKFPQKYHNRDELVKLPGIGQKTANVISNVLWGAPNIGVDTHVFRLAHRFGWAEDFDNTPEKVEVKLLKVIPKKYHSLANNLLVMHGRYICKAIKPLCSECPVYKICDAKDKR